jgi:small-conductance mechanosensitive channel
LQFYPQKPSLLFCVRDYTKPAAISIMLVPNETIIGQSHLNRRRTWGRGIFQVRGRNSLSPSIQGRGELSSFCAMACTRPVENSAMLVPNETIISQSLFNWRRELGEPLPEYYDAGLSPAE